MFSVQIETSVVATQLKRKLESLNIATKAIEGGGLFSEASSKVDEQRNAAELLKKIISKYPQAAYAIEVGKPDIVSVDPSTNMANVNIPLIFRWDKSFLAELGDVLSRVAREKLELTPYDLGMGMTPIARAYYGAKEHNGIICIGKRGVLKNGKADTCWVFQRPLGQGEGDNLLNLPVVSGSMTLSISFKDRENKTVEVISYALQRGDSDTWMGQRIAFGRNDIHFSLQLDLGTFHPPNVLWSSDHDSYNSPATRHVLLISDGVFNLTVKAQIRVENLKNISSMEVHFDPWKN